MKISKVIIGLISLTAFTGCVEGNNKMKYDIKNITDVTYKIENTTLELSYSPLMESLYYSPGVTYKTIKDKIVIDVTRCGINDDCKVDAKAVIGRANLVKVELGKVLDPNMIFINEINELNSLNVLSKQ